MYVHTYDIKQLLQESHNDEASHHSQRHHVDDEER
jgi:hypothetical protein